MTPAQRTASRTARPQNVLCLCPCRLSPTRPESYVPPCVLSSSMMPPCPAVRGGVLSPIGSLSWPDARWKIADAMKRVPRRPPPPWPSPTEGRGGCRRTRGGRDEALREPQGREHSRTARPSRPRASAGPPKTGPATHGESTLQGQPARKSKNSVACPRRGAIHYIDSAQWCCGCTFHGSIEVDDYGGSR